MKNKLINPKQRLILYPAKETGKNIGYILANNGMFCKTLERAKEILRQIKKESLKRAIFYDGKGVATKLYRKKWIGN